MSTPGDAQDQARALLGRSPRMRELLRLIQTVAPSQASVLIQGESGTGKELVARAIHARSTRRRGPFVAISCSTLPETLLESELFGHARGAFTGATDAKKGLLAAAHGGTLFLDEVGEISSAVQIKLLRALQSGEIRPIGRTGVIRIDVRLIAATNADLLQLKDQGALREDLYYRLAVITLRVPPLRERMADVPMLAYHFLRRFAALSCRPVTSIDAGALGLLTSYPWPGNVRELENVIERATVLGQGPAITAAALPPEIFNDGAARPQTYAGLDYRTAREAALLSFNHQYVVSLLQRTGGNLSESARLARLDRSNFRRLLRRCGITAKDIPAPGEASDSP